MIPRRSEARATALERGVRARAFDLPVEVRSPLHVRVRALFGRRRRERLARVAEQRAADELGDRIVDAGRSTSVRERLEFERATGLSERERVRQELLAEVEGEGGGGAAPA